MFNNMFFCIIDTFFYVKHKTEQYNFLVSNILISKSK
jgi:hypothetical protein